MRSDTEIRIGRLLCCLAMLSGCSPTEYRLQADREAYDTIAERNDDPRWQATDVSIEIDPRSRYFDEYDPDHSPMPADDPVAHDYMHRVDGKEGWAHWHDDGERTELENPRWREVLAEYVELGEGDAVRLDMESALRLAYVHSPNHQSQLETLYLSALDVTEERFRLDTQFFAGSGLDYVHGGKLNPPSIAFDNTTGKYVISPGGDGAESNRVAIGSSATAQRRFATAGQLLAGFANSFVFEFTGGDANLTASLANFSLIQPLLRGAGRDIALEQLTRAERNLLGSLRAYGQFRQGFYTNVAIGELGVVGPQRNGSGTNLQSFSGFGGVGGYVGLLQQIQQIRNTEVNLKKQREALEQLEFKLRTGSTNLEQVDRFRQSVEREKASLLRANNSLELSLDRYITQTLGLPPDLALDLDDTFLKQFELISPDAIALGDKITDAQKRVGQLPEDENSDLAEEVSVAMIEQLLTDFTPLVEQVGMQLATLPPDLERMEEIAKVREADMLDIERELFQRDRDELRKKYGDLMTEYRAAPNVMKELKSWLDDESRAATVDDLIDWLRGLSRIVERSISVQVRARVESVTVEPVALRPPDAFQIALRNRLDFMNGRAALVDSWRLIQFNRDALQSVLNVTADGNVQTSKNNPLSFRAPTTNLRLGLEFDAPITRLIERNDYREALINYQRSRRGYIQSRDSLNQGLRALLRQIDQLRKEVEIQRRAVTIANRRVDFTQALFDAPVAPAAPGARPNQGSPTAAIDRISALSSRRDSQNDFLRVWLEHYTARLRLVRELGIMELSPAGEWVENEIPAAFEPADGAAAADEFPPASLPPADLPPGNLPNGNNPAEAAPAM